MVTMTITNHYHNGEPTIDNDGTSWATFIASDKMSIHIDGPRQEVKEIAVALNEMKNVQFNTILLSECD